MIIPAVYIPAIIWWSIKHLSGSPQPIRHCTVCEKSMCWSTKQKRSSVIGSYKSIYISATCQRKGANTTTTVSSRATNILCQNPSWKSCVSLLSVLKTASLRRCLWPICHAKFSTNCAPVRWAKEEHFTCTVLGSPCHVDHTCAYSKQPGHLW